MAMTLATGTSPPTIGRRPSSALWLVRRRRNQPRHSVLT